jgi:hypothetical protein
VVAETLGRDNTPVPVRLLLLEAMTLAALDKMPASWTDELGRSLEHSDQRVVSQAIATIRARGVTSLDETLLRLGRDERQPPEVRVAALSAVAPRLSLIEASLFDYLRAQLDQKLPPLVRLAAADALSRVRLHDDQLAALADTVGGTAGAATSPSSGRGGGGEPGSGRGTAAWVAGGRGVAISPIGR